MDLDKYLALPDALSVRDLCARLDGLTTDAMLRQFRRWYSSGRVRNNSTRQPGPAVCAALVRIDKRMTVQALRPDDWFRIWPNLNGASKARAAAAKEVEPA